jgi:uncharacterized protein YkwD
MALGRLLAIAVFAAGAFPAGAQPTAPEEKSARVLALVNAARVETGQAVVVMEPRLTAAACSHARDLARGGPLSHRGSDGSDLADRLARTGYPFAMAAENLAAGVATPDETVWLWLGSPGHRRNMLTAEFREAGIAHLSGAGGEIWVLVLGRPLPASAGGRPPEAPNARQSADLGGDKGLTCY